MARRTIRARRASPYQLYLLIAFVVIAVVCGVGWAWTWSIMNHHNVNTFGVERAARAKEASHDLWRELLDKYAAPDANIKDVEGDGLDLLDVIQAKEDLANEYEYEIKRLTQRLMGDPFDPQHGRQLRQSVSDVLHATNDVLVQASQALKESYQVVGGEAAEVRMTSMQAAVTAMVQRLEAMGLQVRQDNQSTENLQAQIEGLQEELAAAKQEHQRQEGQLRQDLADEKDRLEAARDSAIQLSNRFREESKALEERLQSERQQWEAEREKLDRQILTLKDNMKDLQNMVAEFRKIPPETPVDGHVVQVTELGAVAYGDIGKEDGVLLGMPFSIFSPAQLGTPEPQPKARARVVRVMADSCELRIYEGGNEPIVVGDILHNPVYERGRRLRFMLAGQIDMDADGVDDTERLKAMIQEFGGQIDTTLTVQTDYLILGEEPKVGPPPEPDASPMERQLYEEVRRMFTDYVNAKAKAQDFSIPILSLNRFLGLMGVAEGG